MRDERARCEIVYCKVRVFLLKPSVMVFLYNISESISRRRERSVGDGVVHVFLDFLRCSTPVYLVLSAPRPVLN